MRIGYTNALEHCTPCALAGAQGCWAMVIRQQSSKLRNRFVRNASLSHCSVLNGLRLALTWQRASLRTTCARSPATWPASEGTRAFPVLYLRSGVASLAGLSATPSLQDSRIVSVCSHLRLHRSHIAIVHTNHESRQTREDSHYLPAGDTMLTCLLPAQGMATCCILQCSHVAQRICWWVRKVWVHCCPQH